MSRHRARLPQLGDALFLTDGGLETTLVFQDALELPCFAAFTLLADEAGRARLRRYFEGYLALALEHGAGMVLESATWRANPDWGARLGYSPERLAALNRDAIALIEALREERETEGTPMVLSGCVGPRGDGYDPSHRMSPEEAADYHRPQIETFAGTAADMITGITMNYLEESLGIVRAAREAGLPSAISFTVETDGRLATGQTLRGAIETLDAETGAAPAYYMINCAHPVHFESALEPGAEWTLRIRGLRANASTRSHAELDEATELDAGDPEDLGLRYRALRDVFPQLTVLGGCCGTDERHVGAIGRVCTAPG